jgi:hypothetical protein
MGDIKAVHVWHADVDDGDLGQSFLDQLDRFTAAVARRDLMSFQLQQDPWRLQRIHVVIYE